MPPPAELPLNGPCGVCGVQTQYRCARCGLAFFCSRAHQRQAWSTATVGPMESCSGTKSDAQDASTPAAAAAAVESGVAVGPEPSGHSARCVVRPEGPLVAKGFVFPSWPATGSTATAGGNNNNSNKYNFDDVSIGPMRPPPMGESTSKKKRAADDQTLNLEAGGGGRGGLRYPSSRGSAAANRALNQLGLPQDPLRRHVASFDSGSSSSGGSGSGVGSGSSTAGSTVGFPTESSFQGGTVIGDPLIVSDTTLLPPTRNNNNTTTPIGFRSDSSAFEPATVDPFTTPPRAKQRLTQAFTAAADGGGFDNGVAMASSTSKRPATAPSVGGGGGSGGGDSAVHAAQVEQLMDMGVCPDPAAASKALRKCRGSVERAVEWLLEGGLAALEDEDLGEKRPSLNSAVNFMNFTESELCGVGGGSGGDMAALSAASLAFHDKQMRQPLASRFRSGGYTTGDGGGASNGDYDDVDSVGAGSGGHCDERDSTFVEFDTPEQWQEDNLAAACHSGRGLHPPPPPQRPGTPDSSHVDRKAAGGGGGTSSGGGNGDKGLPSSASWVDDGCFVAEFPLAVTRGVSEGPPWHRALQVYVYRVQPTATEVAKASPANPSATGGNSSSTSTSDIPDLLFVIDELPPGSNVVGGGNRGSSSNSASSHGGGDAFAPTGGGAALPPSEGVRRLALVLSQSEIATLSRVHLPGTRQQGDWVPSEGTTWLSATNIGPLAHALASTFLEARPDSVSSLPRSSAFAPQASEQQDNATTGGSSGASAASSTKSLQMQYVLCVPKTRRVVARSVQVSIDHHSSSSEDARPHAEASSSAAACYEAARGAKPCTQEEEEELTVLELASQQGIGPSFSSRNDDEDGFSRGVGSSSAALRENHFRPVDSTGVSRQVQFGLLDPAFDKYLEDRRRQTVRMVDGICGDDHETQRRSPPPPPVVADENKVAMLTAMGFPDELARATLLEHRNDVESAAEALFSDT